MISTTEQHKNNAPKQRLKTIAARFLALIFWLAVWQAASYFIGYDILLPSPIKVLKKLFELLFLKDFWGSVLFSAVRVLSGFFFAVAAASLLAAMSGWSRYISFFVSPLMSVMKSVPLASFVVLVLIWLDSAHLSAFIAFIMVLPIMYINIMTGISCCDEKLLEMSKVFKVKRLNKFLYIYIPEVYPYFRSGCSVSLGLCWKAGIAAELIGMADNSIGEWFYFSKIYFLTADLLAWTVVVVVLSVFFEKVIVKAFDLLFTLYGRS